MSQSHYLQYIFIYRCIETEVDSSDLRFQQSGKEGLEFSFTSNSRISTTVIIM